MRRFLPKSLLGQMVLAVALALLFAQTLSAILIYQAEENRREAAAIHGLAFQLVADPRFDFRDGDSANGRRAAPRRRLRIQRTLENPLLNSELRDPMREARLTALLVEQGIAIDQLVVLERDVAADRFTQRRNAEGNLSTWSSSRRILLAGLKRSGEDEWLVARLPRPDTEIRNLGGLIVQTFLLYIILVGGLVFLLRRITRPLAALTDRVEQFATTREASGQLEPSGPEDARRLIIAHNDMEDRIAALISEKDVMLGAIGHDLKTPLAALRVRIESVEDDSERQKMAATIEDITSSLDDILSLARVGRPTDPLERTDLGALVSSVVEEYEDMGDPVELRATQKIALPLRATWLRRAIRNLVGNALRYGGKARVDVGQENSHAVIRIEDDGPGIHSDQIGAMLEPFTRGEASRNRETGGAGLGLTLARAIAQQHGGSLRLFNRMGDDGAIAGLVAELRLPLA